MLSFKSDASLAEKVAPVMNVEDDRPPCADESARDFAEQRPLAPQSSHSFFATLLRALSAWHA